MNTAMDQLAMALVQKPLEECGAEELQQLTERYPWFAPAQLLYAKKLQAGDPGPYEDQLQKASLYFPNRPWLDYLLEPDRAGAPEVDGEAGFIAAPEPVSDEPAITEPVTDPESPVEMAETDPAPAETLIPDQPAEEVPPPQAENQPEITIPGIKPLPADTGLSFEPFHTVDYFASQGIKLREDEKPMDRFGHQLKSFTEWLKTMKRLPPQDPAKTIGESVTTERVDQLAEQSLAERHILTEAMAEVWIKQGDKAKAEEIYRKLSLLDPPKTAYFAAKIEELKTL